MHRRPSRSVDQTAVAERVHKIRTYFLVLKFKKDVNEFTTESQNCWMISRILIGLGVVPAVGALSQDEYYR